MRRIRFVWLLPLAQASLATLLWFWAREQYFAFAGRPEQGWWLPAFTDYTPPAIQVAGMLNVPVATFAYPLYPLVHLTTSTRELLCWLLGVAILWAYIGWVVDCRGEPLPLPRAVRVPFAILGILFGCFLLLVTLPMFHVGIFYKAAAIVWTIAIWQHFWRLLRPRRIRAVPGPPS